MKDILIVGFGLAGISVAHHAQAEGLSFDILNDNSQKSSQIAGGILNPVAIKRMKPVWSVEAFLPYAIKYYQSIEDQLGRAILTQRDIKVYVQDNYKDNLWFEALDNKRVALYLSDQLLINENPALSISKLGRVSAHQVDLPELISGLIEHYSQLDCYKEQGFDYSAVQVSDSEIVYGKTTYKNLIFCEGYGIVHNPFFNALGIYGNKGDYLIFKAKGLKSKHILKSRYFLIPLGGDTYKFGATYQRKPLNHEPSAKARADMLEALDKMIDCSYEVIEQVCGIRPTTKDRKPILGTHYKHKNMHVFNGFGSRGVMTSPRLGKQLLDHIFHSVPLPKDISVNRIYAQT